MNQRASRWWRRESSPYSQWSELESLSSPAHPSSSSLSCSPSDFPASGAVYGRSMDEGGTGATNGETCFQPFLIPLARLARLLDLDAATFAKRRVHA